MSKMVKKKAPKPDMSAQDAALAMQRTQAAQLDEEENRRRKRLFSAAQGSRAFTGSPLFRRAPGNAAGSAPSSVSAPTGGAPRGSSVNYRGGSGRGRSMIP